MASLLPDLLLNALLLAIPGGLILGFLVLAGWSFLIGSLSERTLARHTQLAFVASALASITLLVDRLIIGQPWLLDLNVVFPAMHGLLVPSLRVDVPAALLLTLFTTLLGLVGRFSATYLHREPGFERFFLLLWLFAAGVVITVVSAGADFLFIGWELVGLTSALLIGFFRDREQPVRAGLRAWIIYRACDAALLTSLLIMHHLAGSLEWQRLGAAATTWSTPMTWTIAALLIVGGMGKSAQAPLTSWLPSAMEGPTPSSALFYGAISVHLGAWLLLKARPIIAAAPGALILVGAIGASTALASALIGRTRPDIKTALGWATSAQLGIIWVEIALGLETLALLHIVGHALLRAFQLLRSPAIIQDVQRLHAATGARPSRQRPLLLPLPASLERRLYTLALHRFYMDAALQRLIVAPFLALSSSLDALDRRAAKLACGDEAPEEMDAVEETADAQTRIAS